MSDWTSDAADMVEQTVALLRDRTVAPAQVAAKAIVYGLLTVLIVIPTFILATVGAFRGLVLLYQGYVWAAYVTLGGIFTLAGVFCWSKRKP
jgi:hypothetical protein